jgi:hypothetical protein
MARSNAAMASGTRPASKQAKIVLDHRIGRLQRCRIAQGHDRIGGSSGR